MPGQVAIIKAALVALALSGAFRPALAQTEPAKPVDMAKELRSISTPNALGTRIGPLQFNHGRPTPKTAEQLYEHLDFVRAVDVFLNAMPGASLQAMRRGHRSMGAADNTFVVFEHYLDSKTLALTGNTESLFASGFLDLTNGPLVLEYPPRVQGVIDDMWFRHVADYGMTGPDKGKGGKFLLVPPGYKGKVPTGFHVARPRTNVVWAITRGLADGGDVSQVAMQLLSQLKVYPLAQADAPPASDIFNGSGHAANTVPPNDISFFEDIDNLVQAEPLDALDPELTGQLAAIGIVKGKPFNPDARMKRILSDAATLGSATARAILFKPRDPAAYLYPDSAWITPLMGGGYQFMRSGARLLDARVAFHYGFTVVTPSMLANAPGAGQQYAVAAVDSAGDWLEGGKLYRLQLQPNVPAKESWSVTLYDPQTRSLLQTEKLQPVIGSQTGKLKANADGSIDLWFGPKAPTGKEDNWLQTAPGKGWFAILRLNAPLKPWFDKSWKPGEFEEMR